MTFAIGATGQPIRGVMNGLSGNSDPGFDVQMRVRVQSRDASDALTSA